MVESSFRTILVSGDEKYDFSVIESWHIVIQELPDIVHIGVLGTSEDVEKNFQNFVHEEKYKSSSCDFVLITEAGELIASNIEDRWKLHVEDIHEAFQRPIEQPDEYKNTAHAFLKEKFNELDENFDRIEVNEIIQAVSKQFAELVARDPRALEQLEWRDLERMLAEVFSGIGFEVKLTPPSKDGGKDIILQCVVSGRMHSYIVEIKHWRSSTRVGGSALKDFIGVVVKEKRDAGIFLSTYGFTSNAFEAISEIERHKIRCGEKEKIISLCKTYVDAQNGLLLSSELLPAILTDGTS